MHIALLATSLLLLPIGPGFSRRLATNAHPALLIFELLAATIGLPFLTLSATSPLLQAWLAARDGGQPYRLFAVSNFASLAALLAYPVLIEPLLGTEQQRVLWSFFYAAFAILCAATSWRSRHRGPEALKPVEAFPLRWQWFALPACGSMLLLSITNHIDENVAAVPLLWVLPLAVYLVSFVFTFGARRPFRPGLWLRLLAFALGVLAYAIYNINARLPLPFTLAIFLGGLFVCCIFCHGELNRLRPPASGLTVFYLLIAAGGAFGALLIGIVAPHLFTGIYELPVTLLLTSLLALALTWTSRLWTVRVLWLGVSVCLIAVLAANVQAYHEGALSLRRSFYGALRVVQTPHAGPEQQRILYHGTIEHGAQFLLPPRRERPTTYYGPDSGAGILLRECLPNPKRVAIVGLGAGTLATYGQPGDAFYFYEINSQVADIAESLFFYLRESRAAIHIQIGDGRLLLERESSGPFDAIVLDAFSGDAIPVHLLTAEALAVYLHHLTPAGALAFHVSNDYLDLAPVVAQLAAHAGLSAVVVHNSSDPDEAILPADWVIVTRNPAILENASVRAHLKPIAPRPNARLWTDDYSGILSVFRMPRVN
ncbi:MAG TPA: fused MFS/spermidine synthase [Bryobacteraceae bacterium]|nr:fused MFS/spermidine synthase [Bryobacteraceae bacterium]